MVSKFRRGETTFNCQVCKRLTRHTGVQSVGSELCPQCFEMAGLENMVQDGTPVDEIRAEALSLAADVAAKGGKPDIAFLLEHKERRIVTKYDPPPIPERSKDWSATFADYDEGDPIGHGATELDALCDLMAEAAVREVAE